MNLDITIVSLLTSGVAVTLGWLHHKQQLAIIALDATRTVKDDRSVEHEMSITKLEAAIVEIVKHHNEAVAELNQKVSNLSLAQSHAHAHARGMPQIRG